MRLALVLGLSLAVLVAGAPASAEGPPPSTLEFAASEHQLAQQAWLAKNYEMAAVHFENAFFAVPRASELRAAILARSSAKEWARAATLATLGHRKYPGDTETAKRGDDAIRDAKPHVHEVVLACALECGVAVDTKVVTIDRAKEIRFFLDPGRHEIVVSWGDDRVTKTLQLDARAGATDTIKADAPELKPAPSSASNAAGAPSSTSTPLPNTTSTPSTPSTALRDGSADRMGASRKPLGPFVFYTGATLTLLAGAGTVVSGIDARNNPGADAVRRNCVGLGDACPDYQKGRDAQLRTNVLLAVTGGLFAATAVVGLFFTAWSKPPAPASRAAHVEPVVGLGQVGVRGSF